MFKRLFQGCVWMKSFTWNFFTFSFLSFFAQERDPNKATLAKVIPTPNNGFAELVALQRDQVSLHNNSPNTPHIALIENMVQIYHWRHSKPNWKQLLGLEICWENGLKLLKLYIFPFLLPTGWKRGTNSVFWVSKDPLRFWPQREEMFPPNCISHQPPAGSLSVLAWLPGRGWPQGCRKTLWHQSCWDGGSGFLGAVQREGHCSVFCFPGMHLRENIPFYFAKGTHSITDVTCVCVCFKQSSVYQPSGFLCGAVVSRWILVLQRFYTFHAGGVRGLLGPAANEEHVWDSPHGEQALHDPGALGSNSIWSAALFCIPKSTQCYPRSPIPRLCFRFTAIESGGLFLAMNSSLVTWSL